MMDDKHIKPFVTAFQTVMPQLGFGCVTPKEAEISTDFELSGVIIIVGLVGTVKGNVAYSMDLESAKKIVSTMMMGMSITEWDEITQSALAELSNMLTANAATVFCNLGETVDISTPSMFQGEHIGIKMGSNEVIQMIIEVDEIPIMVKLSITN